MGSEEVPSDLLSCFELVLVAGLFLPELVTGCGSYTRDRTTKIASSLGTRKILLTSSLFLGLLATGAAFFPKPIVTGLSGTTYTVVYFTYNRQLSQARNSKALPHFISVLDAQDRACSFCE